MKGYIHVYTGNGKGKTTAALGLALRAAGAGKKVFFAQFVKGKPYAEHESVRKCLPLITIRQYGLDCFIVNKPEQQDIDAARAGLQEVAAVIASEAYDLVVLDEATIALYYGLFSLEELMEVVHSRPESMEIVITGRYAPEALIGSADLVTEMKEVKHYYQDGVQARKGIEY
jgi:cob(I)alamin adenosyltransferase